MGDWAHKSTCSLTPPIFIEEPVPNQESGLKPGADPGFQVRGGALKKIAPSRGRHENFWGISCKKSRFYAKKSYFSNFRGGGGGGGGACAGCARPCETNHM